MCRVDVAGKRSTGGSDAQADMCVRTVPEHPFCQAKRPLVFAQKKASVRHRRKICKSQRSGVEPFGTTKVLNRQVRMSLPDVEPATICPRTGKIGVQFQGPVNELPCWREVMEQIGHRPRGLAQSHAVILAYPYNNRPKSRYFASPMRNVVRLCQK